MGTWGTGIMESDLAQDVKSFFDDSLSAGKSVPVILREARDKFADSLTDPDEYPDLILALAWLASSSGELPPELGQEAKKVIVERLSLTRWVDSGDYEKRRNEEERFLDVLEGRARQPEKPKPDRIRTKVGDIYEIPLASGMNAYAQYACTDKKYGALIRVFNLLAKETPSLDAILASGLKFPPVITIPRVAVNAGRWRIIGNRKVKDFVFPAFRAGNADSNGRVSVWWLYDGKTDTRVDQLPEGAEKYEVLVIWGFDNLERRIESGIDPRAHWR